jgi:hypothetical protein
MDTFRLKCEEKFACYIPHPDRKNIYKSLDGIEILNTDYEFLQSQSKFLKEGELEFFKTENNITGLIGKEFFTYQDDYDQHAISLKSFKKNGIKGFSINNVRPARGYGFVSFSMIDSDEKAHELFLLMISIKTNDPIIWDRNVKIFETNYFQKILDFFETGIINREEKYNC